MNRKNLYHFLVISFICAASMGFTGCGGKSSQEAARETAEASEAVGMSKAAVNFDDAAGYNSYDALEEPYEAVEEEYAAGTTASSPERAGGTGGTDQAGSARTGNRKLITNVDMRVEAIDITSFGKGIEDRTLQYGGYVEGSSYYGDNYSVTVRIPSGSLEEFLKFVGENANILSTSRNTRDVTLEYTDVEAHKRVLQTEQKQLLEIMEKAETVEEILSVQSALTDVRYELDSINSRLKTMDNQIDYSTVIIDAVQTKVYTPAEEQSISEKMTAGFQENLEIVREGVIDFAIWFVTHIPQLVVLSVIILIMIGIIKLISSWRKKHPPRPRPERKRVRREAVMEGAQNGADGQALSDQEDHAGEQQTSPSDNSPGMNSPLKQ